MGSFMQVYTDGGGIREARVPDDYSGNGSQPFILKFPGFRKSLLASLVTSSTASRTSGVVTITATAHGVTTGSTYVGFRFFYPGSPSLAAGWYDSITDVQTNTISFNAPGANFGSESVNGAAIYTTETTVWSSTLPANTLTNGSEMLHRALKSCTNSANNHYLKCKIGVGNTFHSAIPVASAANAWSVGYVTFFDTTKAAMVSGSMASGNASMSIVTMDSRVDQPLFITLQLSAASEFITIISSTFEVIR